MILISTSLGTSEVEHFVKVSEVENLSVTFVFCLREGKCEMGVGVQTEDFKCICIALFLKNMT